MIKKLFYTLILFVLVGNLSASHLVGGSLGYEYLGQVGSNYRYKIILVVYNNCDANSQIPLPVATQPVSVYDHDVSATTPLQGNDKPFEISLNLNLIDSHKVEPPVSSGCAIGQDVCIYKGVYEGIVDLPLSFTGYHLYFENFARNAAITNLFNPGGTGMAFHAYIPPTLVNNSSPVFSDDPVPFLCVNDTVSILNTAIDPDGDQLVFSFITPMASATQSAPNNLSWPINPVTYNVGYSTAQPFGAAGYSFINGATGLTQYMSPTLGNFVVAVEIKEIRNGNVIGITRRDLQLLVITCPPNPAPNLSSTGGSGTTQYTIQECDTLTFPVTFTDPNGDSLFLSTSGQIFDTSFVNPAALIDSLVIGDSTVTASFVWGTSCGTAQALPYQFTVSTTDNGCPPKTTNVVYQITVEPPTPPDSIIGPPLVCQNSTVNYSVDTIPGYSFTWTVTNGTITSGQGSSTISVNWPNIGAGTVSVIGVSECGCPSAFIDTAITIVPVPSADAGADTTICFGDTIQIGGSPTGPPGTTFLWNPNTNMNDSTASNPLVWPSSTTTYIVTVDNGTCTNTDTITVFVGTPNLDAGPDTALCVGDTIQLNAAGGITYAWTPNINISDTSVSNPFVFPTTTTTYFVMVGDTIGCVGSDSLTVTVDTMPVPSSSPDTSVCFGTCVQLTASGGTSYLWTPGSTLSDSTIASPTACPVGTTTYLVDVTSGLCVAQDTVTVTINPPPVISTNNDTAVCIGTCVSLSVSGASTYIWSPATGLSNDTIANPVACPTTTTTYIVSGTDTNGCIGFDTVTITVNALPVVDAGPDQSICDVGTVVIGGTPTGPVGATYAWTPSGTLNDTTLANPSASPISTTTYTVTVTDTNGCSDFDVITVTLNTLPVVNAGSDTTICFGESVVIGGTPTGPNNSSYSWVPPSTLNNDTIANPTATPTATTQYIVTVTDSNNCQNADTVEITVNPLPVITVSNDTAMCIGTCYQLIASGAITYVWTPAAGLSNDSIANPVACPVATTTYVVTGTDGFGCFDTASVTVTINPLPIITTSNDTSVCFGTCAQLSASGGVGYSWSPGATLSDSTLSNPLACPTVNTTYVVTVTDGNGCVDTGSVTVSIDTLPIVEAGPDTSLCINDSIQLNASGAVGYAWTPNMNISDTSVANPIVFPTVTTTYYVVGTNANGCENIDSVEVVVNSLPVILTSNDTAICIGGCAQLSASGGLSYTWNPGGTLSDSTLFNPVACPTTNTTYTVTVSDTNSCSDTASVSVTINPLPVVDAGPDLWLCEGDSIQLNGSGAIGYSWSPGGTLSDSTIANPMASPLDTTNYVLTGVDANGCTNTDTVTVIVNDEVPIVPGNDTTICAGDTVMLGGMPTSPNGTSYQWFPNGGTLNNDTIANPMAFPAVTTTYYVVATNDTCTAIDSVTITVNPLPAINAGSDIAICIGDSTQLIATGGLTYTWQPGNTLTDSTIANPTAFPTVTTDYTVFGTDTNGCSAFDTVQVVINPLPTISAGGSVQVCRGDSIQLNATGGVSYVWTPSAGLSNDTIANPMASPSSTTTYTVTGTDANGCMNSDSIEVTINQLSVPDLSDTIICIGESLQLYVNGPAGATYNWTPATDLSDSTIANPITTTQVTITYTVVVTDTNGCKDTTSVLVNAEPKPTADFGMETTPYCDGILAEFTNLSIGSSTYTWDFGDGEQSTEINPEHLFLYGNTYTILLTAYHAGICTDTATMPIDPGAFEDYFSIVPPTVLTPNDDGMNDLFKMDFPEQISGCVNIQVFDRWGIKLYESQGLNSGWDGRTTAGSKVPDGTYFYIIEVNGMVKKGSITLMR
ncbi:MAG: gliding motility-associated C-terminal domain-containing protein [Flavobacteriales bacterium]|nr:gliding motility-associated C-terminal domain-containing protein [Flavobacteriales bacterium]